MEVLFHFIFELVKIAILASFYAFLILLVFQGIAKYKPGSWFDKNSRKKLRLWFLSGLIFSLSLFIYMFSYWGNHGLGDGPRIPIGHGLTIDNTNWTEYGSIEEIKTSENQPLEMTKFYVIDDELIGNLDSWFYNYQNVFFVLDLESQELKEFESKNSFDQYVKINNLPSSVNLLTFEQNYRNRWGGWRFWLLP